MHQSGLFGDPPAQAVNTGRTPGSSAASVHTCFFAVRPSADEAHRIHASAAKLLASKGISGKSIDPERLHVTLEFIGHDVDDATLEAACRAADAVRFAAFEARFDAAMTFATHSGPFVLVGSEGLDAVRRLRTELVMSMADRGFRPSRAYEPHMTLCYDSRHRVARTPIESIGFEVSEFVLVKSHVGLSRHEVLRTWSLEQAG